MRHLTREISQFSIEQTFEFMSMDIKDYGPSDEGEFRRESMTCRKRKEKIDFVCRLRRGGGFGRSVTVAETSKLIEENPWKSR